MIDHKGNVQPQLDLEEHAHISGVPGKKVFNVDSSGNVVNFETISVTQNVTADPNNSSTTNLASGATFEGTKTSTLGVVGLQWSLYTTQNCTVYIEQSPDGTNWDISYHYDYIASKGGQGETVQATQSYWRIRVTNEGTIATTAFRLQGVLCPIATPLPSSLSDDARLKTETTLTGRHNSERHAWINPTNEQAVSPVYRMVGTNFDGVTLDPNFWTDGSLLSGSITQVGGEIDLHTNAVTTTAASSAKYTSVRKARFVAGSAMMFEGGFNFKTAYTENNIRRVGAYTTTADVNTPVDGFYFELSNATFSVNSRANEGTVSSVASGSFNGNMGAIWTPTADTYYKLSIEYTPLAVFFYVNGELLHKKAGAHQSYFMTLPITIENLNTSGATDVSFESVGMYIAREGELTTNQTSKFIIGDANTTICKYGAGVVKGIVISGVADDTEIDFYDGTSDADTLLWSSGGIKAKTDYAPLPVDLFGLPFSNGLAIKVSVDVCNVLVIYE